jgi:hypothetical protein
MSVNDDKENEYILVGKRSKENRIISYEPEFDRNNGQYEDIEIRLQEQYPSTNTIYKVVEYKSPYNVYYIDDRLGQICYGTLKGSDINPLKSIINIVPRKLTYFYNPIFPKAEPKVQLEYSNGLEHSLKKIGPSNNVNEILKILENDGYLLNKSKAPDAFNSIVSAMKENKGLVENIEDVTTPGYYLVKDNIIKKDITQRKNISKEDAEKCCLLLDKLAEEGWVNKNIFPTVLKWAILAPFSFVIKQLDKNNFLPWLILYGKSKSGKSTLGEISSKIWRSKDSDKGFSSIDTMPKLGQILSQTTYPVLINEVGVLSTNNSFGKYNSIIEMMKSSITGITARSKFVFYSTYTDIPALCPLILTSNYKIIEDSGFLRRFIAIHFPDVEEKSVEQQENFNKLNFDILGILGDFISQNISIDILKKDWIVITIEILKEFYIYGGREDTPKWIEYFEEQKNIEDEVNEKKHFSLRAFLIEEITRSYSLNSRSFLSDTDTDINRDIYSALNFCLKNKLLPFLHEKNNEIIITIDIMNKINIAGITSFKDIASIIGFEYTSARIGENNNKPMKVLKGSRKNLCKFLDLQL